MHHIAAVLDVKWCHRAIILRILHLMRRMIVLRVAYLAANASVDQLLDST